MEENSKNSPTRLPFLRGKRRALKEVIEYTKKCIRDLETFESVPKDPTSITRHGMLKAYRRALDKLGQKLQVVERLLGTDNDDPESLKEFLERKERSRQQFAQREERLRQKKQQQEKNRQAQLRKKRDKES